jgi:MoaA/NifB/PqqE/SkfB family radical SAM enzyme
VNSKLVQSTVRLLSFTKSSPASSERLGAILSQIDERIQAQASLDEMLEILDRSKPKLFDCLHGAFASPVEAKAVALKILNLCLAKYHYTRRSVRVLSRPMGVVVDPANACNLACPGCVHSENAKELKLFDWSPGLLGETRLGGLLQRYGAYATHVTLCNYGEPLVNPHTPKFIRMAKGFFTRTMLSTNLALPRFDADAYVQSGLDYMVLSIDGATQGVYEKFRRKGKIENVFANVRKLVEAKRRLNRATPIVAWRYLAFEHNVHEIPAAMEKARELGVDQFRAESAWDASWDDPNIRPAEIQSILKEFAHDNYTTLVENWNPFPGDVNVEAIEREFSQSWAGQLMGSAQEDSGSAARPPTTCEWLYKSITMDAGGKVFPCCCAPTANADLLFSKVEEQTSADVFNSDKQQLARLSFADPQAYDAQREAGGFGRGPYCARCEWSKTADPGSDQLRQYFNSTVRGLWNNESLNLLSGWPSSAR